MSEIDLVEVQGANPSQFAESVEAWRSNWASPLSGPFAINGVVRHLLSEEQIAAEQPEEAAYKALTDCAAERLVHGAKTGTTEEVVDDICATLDQALPGKPEVKTKIITDILRKTAANMNTVRKDRSPRNAILDRVRTREAYLRSPEYARAAITGGALALSRYLIGGLHGEQRALDITQSAVAEYSKHNAGGSISAAYLSQLLNGSKVPPLETTYQKLFIAIYEFASVSTPKKLAALPEEVKEEIARFAEALNARNHMTMPGAVIEPRSYNYVVRTEVESLIDRAIDDDFAYETRFAGGPDSGVSSMVLYAYDSAKQKGYHPMVIDFSKAPTDSNSEEWEREIMAQIDTSYSTDRPITPGQLYSAIKRLCEEHPNLVLLLDNCEEEVPKTRNFVARLQDMQWYRVPDGRVRNFGLIEFGHDDGLTRTILKNFSEDQVDSLAMAMNKDPELAATTFSVTQGQPYLTHLLLHYDNDLSNPIVQQRVDDHIAKVAEYIVSGPNSMYVQSEFANLMRTGAVHESGALNLISPFIVRFNEEQGSYAWSIELYKDRLPKAVQQAISETTKEVTPDLRNLFSQ